MFEDLPIQNPSICDVVVAVGLGDEAVVLLPCAGVARTNDGRYCYGNLCN